MSKETRVGLIEANCNLASIIAFVKNITYGAGTRLRGRPASCLPSYGGCRGMVCHSTTFHTAHPQFHYSLPKGSSQDMEVYSKSNIGDKGVILLPSLLNLRIDPISGLLVPQRLTGKAQFRIRLAGLSLCEGNAGRVCGQTEKPVTETRLKGLSMVFRRGFVCATHL